MGVCTKGTRWTSAAGQSWRSTNLEPSGRGFVARGTPPRFGIPESGGAVLSSSWVDWLGADRNLRISPARPKEDVQFR